MLKKIYVRRLIIVFVLAFVWEVIAALKIFSPVLFPPVLKILEATWKSILTGEILLSVFVSLKLIGWGMALGILIAFLLTLISLLPGFFRDTVETLIALLDPLPGVAILPLAILWFGTSENAVIFLIVHSVVWPMVQNTVMGFRSIPQTLLEVGHNLNLSHLRMTTKIRVPAALPSILTGVKVGWARSWRALIAAEMIFGSVGGYGGIGWFIYQRRFLIDMPGVFSGILIIMLIGVIVEDFIFRYIENATIHKWGIGNKA